MSNISKPNSRFAILLEDDDLNNNKNNNNNNKVRDNSNKNNNSNKSRENIENDTLKNEDNIFKSDRNQDRKQEQEKPARESQKEKQIREAEREKLEQEKLEQKKLEKNKQEEKKLEKELSIDNFPELIVQETEGNNDATYISFLDKLKIEKIEKEEIVDIDIELENLEPGWQIIKRDLETSKIIVKSKSIFKPENENKSEFQLAYAVVKGLSFLHEKRTNEYIDKWGYNEWENMFRFQNYDYEYFDKLDELYQEELDAENDYECNDFNEDNKEYNGDYDIQLNIE